MRTHAAVPIAELLDGDVFKIYFSARDEANRSHTGYVLVDITKPQGILDVSASPVLVPGRIGEFDDSGAMATWLTKLERSNFLYYVGWNLGVTVPFRNSIGLAVSQDREKYVRHSAGPILDRSMHEPHFCATCCVIRDEVCWKMWYQSCTEWVVKRGKPEHRYHIKYAESRDGIHWIRNGLVAIDYADSEECAIARPSVMRDGSGWKMWYSFRGEAYRIGYAESDDGKRWNRRDELAGIDVAPSGWDCEMIEYPFVFDHKGDRYMLYNGNGYGVSGFGLAILDAP